MPKATKEVMSLSSQSSMTATTILMGIVPVAVPVTLLLISKAPSWVEEWQSSTAATKRKQDEAKKQEPMLMGATSAQRSIDFSENVPSSANRSLLFTVEDPQQPQQDRSVPLVAADTQQNEKESVPEEDAVEVVLGEAPIIASDTSAAEKEEEEVLPTDSDDKKAVEENVTESFDSEDQEDAVEVVLASSAAAAVGATAAAAVAVSSINNVEPIGVAPEGATSRSIIVEEHPVVENETPKDAEPAKAEAPQVETEAAVQSASAVEAEPLQEQPPPEEKPAVETRSIAPMVAPVTVAQKSTKVADLGEERAPDLKPEPAPTEPSEPSLIEDPPLIATQPFMTAYMPSKELALALFDKLDDNDNHTLSFGELGKVWKSLFLKLTHKASVMKAYQAADQNGDGMLKRDEFEVFLRFSVYYNNCWDAFSNRIGVHLKQMNRKQFKNAAKKLSIVADPNEVFKMMDANDSGVVSYIEYCTWLARNTCEWNMDP